MDKSYKWTKQWVVQTSADDPTTTGDTITVGTNGGSGSQQLVVSVTKMLNRKGEPYNVLLTQEVK